MKFVAFVWSTKIYSIIWSGQAVMHFMV